MTSDEKDEPEAERARGKRPGMRAHGRTGGGGGFAARAREGKRGRSRWGKATGGAEREAGSGEQGAHLAEQAGHGDGGIFLGLVFEGDPALVAAGSFRNHL